MGCGVTKALLVAQELQFWRHCCQSGCTLVMWSYAGLILFLRCKRPIYPADHAALHSSCPLAVGSEPWKMSDCKFLTLQRGTQGLLGLAPAAFLPADVGGGLMYPMPWPMLLSSITLPVHVAHSHSCSFPLCAWFVPRQKSHSPEKSNRVEGSTVTAPFLVA